MRLPRLALPGVWVCAAVLAAISVVAVASIVRATTVERLDDGQLVDRAERIVHGRVLSKEARRARDGVRIFTEYRISPAEFLKQPPAGVGAGAALEPDGTLVYRQWGGEIDGVHFYIPGAAAIEVGEEVLLFVESPGDPVDGVGFTVGLAQGKYRVERDPATGRATARRRLVGLELHDGGGDGAPVRPGAGDEPGRDLDDLKAAIRARVAR